MKACVSLVILPALGTFYFLWCCLVWQDMRAFALSVYILFCTFCLLAFVGLLFSEEEMEGCGDMGEGRWRMLGEVEEGEIGAGDIV